MKRVKRELFLHYYQLLTDYIRGITRDFWSYGTLATSAKQCHFMILLTYRMKWQSSVKSSLMEVKSEWPTFVLVSFLFHSDFILPFLEKLRWSRKAMSLSILKRLSSFRSGNNDLGEISVYYKSLLRQKETRNLSSTPHRIDRLDETVKYIDFYKSLTCTRHTFLKDIPVILQYKTLNNNCFRTILFFKGKDVSNKYW